MAYIRELPASSPLGAFFQSVEDHKSIEGQVTCSFGDLKLVPNENKTVALKRATGADDNYCGSINMNVAELEWLHQRLGRMLGK